MGGARRAECAPREGEHGEARQPAPVGPTTAEVDHAWPNVDNLDFLEEAQRQRAQRGALLR